MPVGGGAGESTEISKRDLDAAQQLRDSGQRVVTLGGAGWALVGFVLGAIVANRWPRKHRVAIVWGGRWVATVEAPAPLDVEARRGVELREG